MFPYPTSCSVQNANIDESISTCRFAQRVALIQNTATLNEELDPTVLISRYYTISYLSVLIFSYPTYGKIGTACTIRYSIDNSTMCLSNFLQAKRGSRAIKGGGTGRPIINPDHF